MNTILWKYKVFGLLLVSLLAGGCSRVANVVVSRFVTVTANDNVCKKSVEVHLVGVNRFEKGQWEQVSMTEYWQPKNQLRDSAKDYTHVIRFGEEPCERTLGKKDPILRVWKKRKAECLFVLVDLPGIHQDVPGNADARRLQLPALDSACWGLQTNVRIAIETSNIIPLTIPTPQCE
jgi:hypothetical protein